jgi:DNA-binding PadR family transcriptional regulator
MRDKLTLLDISLLLRIQRFPGKPIRAAFPDAIFGVADTSCYNRIKKLADAGLITIERTRANRGLVTITDAGREELEARR